MCNDQGDEETVTDIITLNKNHQRIEHLGLTLAESKHLLSTLQQHLLQQQVNTFLVTCSDCPDCGTPLHLKARSRRSFRTLFGTWLILDSRVVMDQVWRNRLFLQAFHGGRARCGIFGKSRLISST
jgi:hypothetical protein